MNRISNVVRRRLLAGELRQLRAAAALTGPKVAKDLGWSTAKFSRMESALIKPSRSDVQALMDYYDVSEPTQERLLRLAEQAMQRNWWDQHAKGLPDSYVQYIGLEHEAKTIVNWEIGIMPGLLQTEAYMEVTNSVSQNYFAQAPSAVRLRTQVRLKRQELLTDPEPLELLAILDEAIMLRSVGGTAIMRPQLEHLLEMARLPNVTIRVMGLAKPNPFPGLASLTQLHFDPIDSSADLVHPDVTYEESIMGGSFTFAEEDTYQHKRALQHITKASLEPHESLHIIRDAVDKMRE